MRIVCDYRRMALACFIVFSAFMSSAQVIQGIQGSPQSIISSSGVSRVTNSTGEFDGNAALMTVGGYVTLDLGAMLTSGDEITFRIGNYFFAGQGHVEVSADGDDYTSAFILDGVLSSISGWRTMVNADFIVNEGRFRYVRIHSSSSVMMLDGVKFTSLSGDLDGDGVNNDIDCKMWDPIYGADKDLDGICDEVDLDIDNDGILNTLERNCNSIAAASAQSVTSAVSISGNGAAQTLVSNNKYGIINRTTDELILDMGSVLPIGTVITTEAKVTSKFHVLGVQTSTDGLEFSVPYTFTWSTLNTDIMHSFSAMEPTRYVRVFMAVDNGSGDIRIDNVRHSGYSVCTDRDTDGDGLADQYDLDTDGDGCFDVLEAGFTDLDADGMLDGTGVDLFGKVTGSLTGYTGTQSAVTVTAFGDCLLNVNMVTHLVNIAQDLSDANIGDGICADVNGNCTLRAAIEEANSGSGLDFIGFEVAGQINLTAPLPVITQSVIIDGSTAPGYTQGNPTVIIRGNGFNLFNFSEVDQIQVKGLDLSGSNISSFDSYALVAAWCTQVEVHDNIIHNRLRAVHFNNSCDISIIGNDLRDSGAESWDAAVYLINICPGGTSPLLEVKGNRFGRINTMARSAVQVVNASNVITSDGSLNGTHIEMNDLEQMDFPLRYVNVQGGRISSLDFSSNVTQQGIGLRLLNSSDIVVDELKITDREVALQITGGNSFDIHDCNFSMSGIHQDYSTILLEGLNISHPEELKMKNITFEEEASTVLNLIDCSGIGIKNDITLDGNIEVAQILRGRAPIRIQSSNEITVSGLTLISNGSYTESKGIYIQGNSSNIILEENYIEGWKTGLSIESANEVTVACNTLALNANGMYLHGGSQVSTCADNSYRCNGVAIYNRSSNQMISQDDFWGDVSGSSSYSGFGDYYIGHVDATAWASTDPLCVLPYQGIDCMTEICDNGVDDDGDGVIDCADNTCVGNQLCLEILVIEEQNIEPEMKQISGDGDFIMFPNPSTGMVNIQLKERADFINVFDMKGQLILRQDNAIGTLSLDLHHVKAGLYQVEVGSANNIQHKTLIIE